MPEFTPHHEERRMAATFAARPTIAFFFRPAAGGALDAHMMRCECGTVLGTSLGERACQTIAAEHRGWHARKAAEQEAPAALTCELCEEAIMPGEKFTDDGSEIAHDACAAHWFRANFGREGVA